MSLFNAIMKQLVLIKPDIIKYFDNLDVDVLYNAVVVIISVILILLFIILIIVQIFDIAQCLIITEKIILRELSNYMPQ